MPLLALLPTLMAPANAAEIQLEGFYRARARALDTLSLNREAGTEGLTAYAQHLLWLRPRILLSDKVGLYSEIRGLDGVYWGQEPSIVDGFVGLGPTAEYGLNAPTTEEGASGLQNITLWRVWGEVHTDYGRFTFGRVPLHWGLGLWLNDGLTTNLPYADHGDTTDRLMWEYLVQEQLYIRLAIDVPSERLVGFEDDTTSYNAAAAYRTEQINAGLLFQFDRTGSRLNAAPLNVFTVDATADVTLGQLQAEAEFVGHFGNGDLDDGLNDATITQLGAALHATLDVDPWTLNVRGGIATGDGVPNDLNLRTYTFDRDYSLGMFMFEHPMPVLSTGLNAANDANDGRNTDAVTSGTALSNAIFVRPMVSRRIVEGLHADAAWLWARTAKDINVGGVTNNTGYGSEFQLGLGYDGIDHLEVDGQFGVFLPGTYYSEIRDVESTIQTGFDAPAFGFQLSTRIHF